MLSPDNEILFEKRLCNWYLLQKGGGSVYAGSIRRWLSQITDEVYDQSKAALGVMKNMSRMGLYNKLNALCGVFHGRDITVDKVVHENIIWDFQVYSVFDQATQLPDGIFLILENESAVKNIAGFSFEKVQDNIYQIKEAA